MSSSSQPGRPPDVVARFHRLTEEIEQLRIALGQKIDEAAELMERITLLDTTSSQSGSTESQDFLDPQFHRARSVPPINP
jgi:hypothetical protein